MNNSTEIYLRRRGKIVAPPPFSSAPPARGAVLAMVKNLEPLGYVFSPELIAACESCTIGQLQALYAELVPILKAQMGANVAHRPLYPNFPAQVMEMEGWELYLNAIVHYATDGMLWPLTERQERFPLFERHDLRVIGLGDDKEFQSLFAQIVGSNASLSETDKADVAFFVSEALARGESAALRFPDDVPQKENAAHLAGLLIAGSADATPFVARFTRTATDVLRLAVALSGGDVSLARVKGKAPRFGRFRRDQRALLLGLLDRAHAPIEDMLRHEGRWKALAHALHVGEHAARFPNAAAAVAQLRSGKRVETIRTRVEAALASGFPSVATAELSSRPGEYARRLDHLLRVAMGSKCGKTASGPNVEAMEDVVSGFARVAGEVSTPVLLQVRHHFGVRNRPTATRTFFPKGQLAKAKAIPNSLPYLPTEPCAQLSEVCERALTERFAALPALGKVYVDPALQGYLVPSGMRSASKALRAAVRGSRLPLPENCDVVRMFLWWVNAPNEHMTDIDLSASFLGHDFAELDHVAYTHLRNGYSWHSGDVRNAPDGASEFIDVDVAAALKAGVRYLAMSVLSYSNQPFTELPECFAGWMSRESAKSGEIFEPRTVQDRLDLTADSQNAVPVVIDLVERVAVWTDLTLKANPRWVNNVEANARSLNATVRGLVEMSKPDLLDLLTLHAMARGTIVATPEEADVRFSVAEGTPFRLEEIASGYMA